MRSSAPIKPPPSAALPPSGHLAAREGCDTPAGVHPTAPAVATVCQVGSGIILLVIVGAWLAVLVPMGLRSHDGPASSRSAERFSDAMRVLSRRSAAAPDPADDGDDPGEDSGSGGRRQAWRRRLTALRGTRTERRTARAVSSPAARRRRVLFTLLVVAAVALLAGLVGPAWLLAVSGLAACLAVLFVATCHRRVAGRSRRALLQAGWEAELLRRERAAAPLPTRHPAPARHEPVDLPLITPPAVPVAPRSVPVAPRPVPAAGSALASPRPLSGALGGEWQPVPVPLPIYVTKAVAPSPAQVVAAQDRPRPAPRVDDTVLDDPGRGADHDAVLEARRAVGGW